MPESAPVEQAARIVKVKIKTPGYDPDQGKMRAGGVYEFPQEQAIRYVRKGVAAPAPASAKTAREEDAERRQQEYQARPSNAALDREMAATWDIEAAEIMPPEWDGEAAKAATVPEKRRRGLPASEPPVFNEMISR